MATIIRLESERSGDDAPVLRIPPGAFVIAVGAAASGKSTFLGRFPPEAVISSDAVRHELHGDASRHRDEARVWNTLYDRVHHRLGHGLTTVLDSTAAAGQARRTAIEAGRAHGAATILVVFDTPLDECLRRNRARRDRLRSEPVPDEVIQRQHAQVAQLLQALEASPADQAVVLTPDLVERVRVLAPMAPVERAMPTVESNAAPAADAERFAIVGDVHGCLDELRALLAHPKLADGRRIVLVGDLTDRGPDSLGVLRAAIDLCESGRGDCVRGNHDDKLGRLLGHVYSRGLTWTTTPLSLGYGIETTIAEFQRLEDDDHAAAEALAERALRFLRSLPYHLVLDGGRLVVSHGGIPAHLIGKEGPHLRRYALFGDPTGAVDSRGFPVRRDLAETYRGSALNVHGHIPIPPPATIRNNVCNVDTSAVFGGALTALLYPERTFVSIPAARAYYAH